MPRSELLPIGVFAQRSGLTASALRFYADSGLLPPAEVDPISGYRYYSPEQVVRATTLRGLREIAMPLPAVEAVLSAGAVEACRLIDEHVANLIEDAAAAQRQAAVLKSSFADVPSVPIAVLKGPVLADAVEQTLTATTREPGMPALGGVRIEVSPEAVTLTATDRYRLVIRTVVPAEPPTITWAGTIKGDELRAAAAEIRRSALVGVSVTPHAIRLRVMDRDDQHCGLLSEEFPDHRLMLASLDEVTTRVTVAKVLLLRTMQEHPDERIALDVSEHGLRILPAGDDQPEVSLPCTTAGEGLVVWFELTTLYPAVSTAIGPDLLLDLRGADQPGTIRSADRGDLTTLVMPVKPGRWDTTRSSS